MSNIPDRDEEEKRVKPLHQKHMYNPDMEVELEMCIADPIYFIENYVMIEHPTLGASRFKLHDYQRRLIQTYHKYRNTISMLSRQAGKCVSGDSLVWINGEMVPIRSTVKRSLKTMLVDVCDSFVVGLAKRGIRLPTPTEKPGVHKFTHMDDFEEMSDFGMTMWSYRTKRMAMWEVKTSKRSLTCADEHMFIGSNGEGIWAKDLTIGYKLQTCDGVERVTEVRDLGVTSHCYDLEINTEQHQYTTNGFYSHNTTTAAAFLLYEAIFKSDFKILICSKDQAGSVEVMDRIFFAYEELPGWMKPGVKKDSVTVKVFENNSKITAIATTPSSGRGKSISLLYCLGGEETVELLDTDTGEETVMSLEQLHAMSPDDNTLIWHV